MTVLDGIKLGIGILIVNILFNVGATFIMNIIGRIHYGG